jgi:hypothetical protein
MPKTIDEFHMWFSYRDGMLTWKKRPGGPVKAGEIAGTSCGRYMRVCYGGKMRLIHRIIFAMHHGYMPECIDHIDGNPFNNRIENLREATVKQNQYNSKTPTHNTSGVKGVSWDASESKWRVQIKTPSGKRNWGRFSSFDEAVAVAQSVKEEHHGKFAR